MSCKLRYWMHVVSEPISWRITRTTWRSARVCLFALWCSIFPWKLFRLYFISSPCQSRIILRFYQTHSTLCTSTGARWFCLELLETEIREVWYCLISISSDLVGTLLFLGARLYEYQEAFLHVLAGLRRNYQRDARMDRERYQAQGRQTLVVVCLRCDAWMCYYNNLWARDCHILSNLNWQNLSVLLDYRRPDYRLTFHVCQSKVREKIQHISSMMQRASSSASPPTKKARRSEKRGHNLERMCGREAKDSDCLRLWSIDQNKLDDIKPWSILSLCFTNQ